jgi:hypothetical protein
VTRQSIRQSLSVLPQSDKTNLFVVGTALLVAVVLIATGVVLRLTDQDRVATPSTWPAPELQNPETIVLSADRPTLNLENDRDYRLVVPCEGLSLNGGLMVRGGRNVVLHNGTITVTHPEGARGLFLNDQTGTVDIANLHIAGNLTEGIDLAQTKKATVQLQNILIDPVKGTRATNHADLVQTWAGPHRLRIDGLRGTTQYQGFFLTPTQRFGKGTPEEVDIRNVTIKTTEESAYALWRDDEEWELETRNIAIYPAKKKSRDALLWPKPSTGDTSWEAVTVQDVSAQPDLTPTPSMKAC